MCKNIDNKITNSFKKPRENERSLKNQIFGKKFMQFQYGQML